VAHAACQQRATGTSPSAESGEILKAAALDRTATKHAVQPSELRIFDSATIHASQAI
jgi:hypothetical protein